MDLCLKGILNISLPKSNDSISSRKNLIDQRVVENNTKDAANYDQRWRLAKYRGKNDQELYMIYPICYSFVIYIYLTILILYHLTIYQYKMLQYLFIVLPIYGIFIRERKAFIICVEAPKFSFLTLFL